MQFNDTTTKNGAIQKCEDSLFSGKYGSISGNNDLLLRFTNLINSGLDKTRAILFKVDGRWQDDDPNFSTVGIATTTLVDSQAKYTLDRNHLMVEGLEVKDASGDYRVLTPIDYRDIRDASIAESEFYKDDGIPQYYDIKGDVVTLYPAPKASDVTLSEGLKIVYKRPNSYFVSTDTTKEMGIPRTFHDLPILFAINEYAWENEMTTKVRETDSKIEKRTLDIKDFYSIRQKDEQLVLQGNNEVNYI